MTDSIASKYLTSLKTDLRTKDIRFIGEHNLSQSEKPVKGYLAVVIITNQSSARYFGGKAQGGVTGERVLSELKFRLYGGRDVSGKALYGKAQSLLLALADCDSGYIDSLEMAQAKVDSVIGYPYRDIDCKLSYIAGVNQNE